MFWPPKVPLPAGPLRLPDVELPLDCTLPWTELPLESLAMYEADDWSPVHEPFMSTGLPPDAGKRTACTAWLAGGVPDHCELTCVSLVA
jgi:hypothetical protein